MDYEEDIPDP